MRRIENRNAFLQKETNQFIMKTPVIAIMRPEMHLDSSIELARSYGFDVVAAPMIELADHRDSNFDWFLQRMLASESMSEPPSKSDIVIFTSANGIRFTLQKIKDSEREGFIQALNLACVVAIGSKTKKALEKHGIRVSMMPESYSSEGIAEMLQGVDCRTIEVVRSAHGDPALIRSLSGRAGVAVHETVVYKLVLPDDGRQRIMIERALAREIDIFAFTSAMTVHNFIATARSMDAEPGIVDALNGSIVAAIGPPTARALQDYGVDVDLVPERFTFRDMLGTLTGKT